MATSAPIGNDSGFGVLEALVVLVIIAGVIAVLATAIRPPPGSTALADITRFVDQARLSAIATGRAVVIKFERDAMSSGADAIKWDTASIKVTTDDGGKASEATLIIYPDGSFSRQLKAAQARGRDIVLSPVVRGAAS